MGCEGQGRAQRPASILARCRRCLPALSTRQLCWATTVVQIQLPLRLVVDSLLQPPRRVQKRHPPGTPSLAPFGPPIFWPSLAQHSLPTAVAHCHGPLIFSTAPLCDASWALAWSALSHSVGDTSHPGGAHMLRHRSRARGQLGRGTGGCWASKWATRDGGRGNGGATDVGTREGAAGGEGHDVEFAVCREDHTSTGPGGCPVERAAAGTDSRAGAAPKTGGRGGMVHCRGLLGSAGQEKAG